MLAVLSGICLAFSAPPAGLTPLLFAWPMLLLASLERGDGSMRSALRLGFLSGFACHVVAFHWVVDLFTGHVPIPWPIAFVLAALLWAAQALPVLVATGLARVLAYSGLPMAVALTVATPLAMEAVWMMFPWRPGEISIGMIELAQVADLTGPAAADVVVVGTAALLYDALRHRRVLTGVAAGALFVGALAYGVPRLREVDALRARAPKLTVGAVQPNVMQHMKMEERLAPAMLDHLRRLGAQAEREGAELVIWPETAYPLPLPLDLERDPVGRRGVRYRDAIRGPIVFGALMYGPGCDHRNSAVALDATGDVVGRADKVALLPFSEFIPFYEHLTFLHPHLPCPGFQAGDGPVPLAVAGATIGVLNCYEDLLPWYARSVVRADADFLLNLTNDAWFFDTAEPHLHHMAASLRAIETRRDLLRVVNTGLTGLVDAAGRSRATLPVYETRVMVVDVAKLPGLRSAYVEHGDRLTPKLAAFALAASVLAAFRSRRRGAAPAS